MVSIYNVIVTILFIVSGAFVTLSLKLIDQQKAKYRNGVEYAFSHPFFQAFFMFISMALCLIPFKILTYWLSTNDTSIIYQKLLNGNQNFKSIIFLPASLFDMIATILNFMGLCLTYTSSFQMLNGSIMIFTGLLSVAFLNRQLDSLKWIGILINVLGLIIIGICDFYYETNTSASDVNGLIAGDCLILIARIFSAMQLVYEEKYINKYNIAPCQAVGYEGIYGCIVLGVLLVPLYYIKTPLFSKIDPENRLENTIDALYQIYNNRIILISFIVNLIATAALNLSGLSVTKELNATTRVIFGNLRTIIVWFVAICMKWEIFRSLQLFAFSLLILGTLVYNKVNVVKIVRNFNLCKNRQSDESEDEERALLNS